MTRAEFLRDMRLVALFAREALVERYRQSVLGVAWLVLDQFVFILIFLVIFSDLMGARLAHIDKPYAYSVYLVSGMLVWNLFANTLAKLVEVFLAKAALIRKVPMRLALLPLYVVAAEWVVFAIAWSLFTVFMVVVGQPPGGAWLWIPAILMGMTLLAYGIGLTLGVFTLFLGDTRHLVGVVLQILFWLTPIVYLPEVLPVALREVLEWHVPYFGIEAIHDTIVFSRPPLLSHLALLYAAGAGSTVLALWLVHRLERDIRDLC